MRICTDGTFRRDIPLRNPTYLALTKNGIFYLRLPIPKHLQTSTGSRHLKFSLSTREPRLALKLSRYLVHIADTIDLTGIPIGMQLTEIRKVLTDHFSKMLEAEKRRIDREGRLTSDQKSQYIHRLRDTETALSEGKPWLGEADQNTILGAFIKKHSLPIARGTASYEWLDEQIKYAYKSFLKQTLNYDASLGEFDLSNAAPSAQTGSSLKLNEAIDRFLRERAVGKVWTVRTGLEKRDHTDLLLDLLGKDIDTRHVTAQHAAQVKQTLMTLPKNWRKIPQCRGMTPQQAATLQDLETLKPPSLNKYFQTYADLFGWIADQGFADKNLFEGMSVRYDKERSLTKREPFSDQQVQKILTHCVELAIVNGRKEYQKWGPLIAAYTGARLNEIAQLKVSDIQQENECWFFDITDAGETQILKTASSKRKIPLHSELIRHGLIEYVCALKEAKQDHLFYELSYTVEHGRGRNLGRWFNEKLLPKLGMKNSPLVFHSFRHTVNTKLVNGGVRDPMIKALLGHRQDSLTYGTYYTSGFPLDQLKEAIETLSYCDRSPVSATSDQA